MKTLELTLGGEKFIVSPLTLGDVEEISALNAGLIDAQSAATPQDRTRAIWKVRREVVAAGLKPDRPTMDADGLKALKIPGDELIAAHNAVLEFAGLVPKTQKEEGGGTGQGEANAGAA